MRVRVLTLTAGLLLAGLDAAAFHEKGVANCNGCHVTHGGESSGALVGPSADKGLLLAESPSDVCLLCHAQRLGAVLSRDPLVPPTETGPGNFVFLMEDNLNDAPGGRWSPILGDAAGHNLVAPGHALRADPRHVMAPGGTFPSSKLGCTSCHDPHGNASFRMLHGVVPVQGGGATELVAVNFDARESDLAPLEAETLERWRGLGVQAGEQSQTAVVAVEDTVPSSLGPWLDGTGVGYSYTK